MIEIVEKFEKWIYAALMAILIVVLIISLVELVVSIYSAFTSPTGLDTKLIGVLGGFLLVLIGVELLDTLKAYFKENTIHVEIVVLLAIIAVARKVLLLDPAGMNTFDFGFELIGIGIIVAGLAAAYYLIKKAGITVGPFRQSPE